MEKRIKALEEKVAALEVQVQERPPISPADIEFIAKVLSEQLKAAVVHDVDAHTL